MEEIAKQVHRRRSAASGLRLDTRAQLDSAKKLQPEVRGHRRRPVITCQCVMVGDGQSLEPDLPRASNQRGGRNRSVGLVGVGVKINHGAAAQTSFTPVASRTK